MTSLEQVTTEAEPRELVTTEEHYTPPERILLKPKYTPARTGPLFQYLGSNEDVPPALEAAARSEYVAVDFETKGNDIADPDLEIAGIGLAWDTGSIYFHWSDLDYASVQWLHNFLLSHSGLLAHNAYFDMGIIRSKFGRHVQSFNCTLASYMMLSNEGWAGQQWGLKSAQTELLLWPSSNEPELDLWLILNGYYKGSQRKDTSPEALTLSYEEGVLKPEKGEMWRAPAPILGRYCVLDAESTYLLWTEFLEPTSRDFPKFRNTILPEFMHLIRTHIDQKLWGLQMDMEGLFKRDFDLKLDIHEKDKAIRNRPELVEHISAIEAVLLQDLTGREPERYKKQPVRPPPPPQFKKDGGISKNYEKWVANESKYGIKEQSLNWEKWKAKWDLAASGQTPEYRFNLNSGQQMADLLYNRLGFPVRIETDGGLPATGVKALKHMGEVGKAITELNWVGKELGFITDYIDRTQHRPSIHPSFRLPGTKTGRLSSKLPNLQQVPKTKVMMSLFRARPGNILVDLDFSALEPVVATEFSNDPNMLQIYGDGKPANDVYLYVGAHIPGMGQEIRGAGYDPRNPTKEGLAAAKKACKAERSICKTVVLACQYGAGVDRVMATLEEDDIFLPREEVEKIHGGYWDLFPEVKQLGRDLKRQLQRNGGYVLNGLGRPMCLTEDYKHDVLNRFIQSTGHDILVKYVYILTHELTAQGIDWAPWVIDWHDATAVEVPEGELERTVQVYTWALDELNRQLGGNIKLKGTPSWGPTMAHIKEPEE